MERIEKKLGYSRREKQKKKMVGIDLDSWHLHIVVFLFNNESCLSCKTNFFDRLAMLQAQQILVIFANHVYIVVGNKNTKQNGELQKVLREQTL